MCILWTRAGKMYTPNDFYIYLSSIGSHTVYPSNTNARFTNCMSPPLNLSGDYAVGLSKCFMNKVIQRPKNINAEAIEIKFTFRYIKNDVVVGRESATYINNETIEAPTFYFFIDSLEKKLREFLSWEKLIIDNDRPIFRAARNKIRFLRLRPRNISNIIYDSVQVSWTPSIQTIDLLKLPHSEGISYDVTQGYMTSELDIFDNNVQYLAVYTDIINSSRFAESSVNILDIVPVNFIEQKHIIYKPLKHRYIEAISIDFRDQNGDILGFEDGKSTTCVLHFKRL